MTWAALDVDHPEPAETRTTVFLPLFNNELRGTFRAPFFPDFGISHEKVHDN